MEKSGKTNIIKQDLVKLIGEGTKQKDFINDKTTAQRSVRQI
jgi:hypothetical protein